jgi:hypothetical protein
VPAVDLWRKTLAFLSHQMVQQVSMVREANDFRFGLFVPDMLIHQSLMERSPIHEEVSMESRLSHPLTMPHSMTVYQHLKKM